jgi:succinate-semialdehyde dehydrogenase/glutarate-semialdehyde dehydrogenase
MTIQSDLLPSTAAYIDGQWRNAASGQTVEVSNPADGSILAKVPQLSKGEVVEAIEAAQSSLATSSTISERKNWLRQLAESLIANRRELGRIITLEHGKPWKEAIGEVEYAASFFRHYSETIEQIKPTMISGRPRDHRWTVHYRPAGVVGLITPWNFPIAMIAKKFSAALAAGCASVIKPSAKTPLTMIALFGLIDQIGLPAGRANLVHGPADEIGRVLCTHPSVRVISFTGSTRVGRKLMEMAAPQLKRLSLELGGNAPFIVFDDANLDQALDAFMQNKFRGAGQTCVCANRLFVHRDIANRFTDRLVARVDAMKVGDGMEPETDIGPLIDNAAVANVQDFVQDAIDNGALCRTGGIAGKAETGPAGGAFFPPTVLEGVTGDMRCAKEEIFGPVAAVIQFDDEEEVVRRANETEHGLAAYVFTSDNERAQRVISQLAFGHVGHNTGTGPTAEAPFGGMKQSGFGREGGIEGLHEYVEPQTVPTPAT